MSWIEIIDEHEATGELATIYNDIAGERGKVSNIMRVHSLLPETMSSHMDLYLDVMFSRSGLSREECEMIATVVSTKNECPYCINHHAVALNAYWRDEERLEAFIEEWRSLDLSDRRTAMLEYASKLTESPGSVAEEDLEPLRNAGLDDENILNLNLVVSYFNFVNRIAQGLGVEFSETEMQGYEY